MSVSFSWPLPRMKNQCRQCLFQQYLCRSCLCSLIQQYLCRSCLCSLIQLCRSCLCSLIQLCRSCLCLCRQCLFVEGRGLVYVYLDGALEMRPQRLIPFSPS